MLIAVLAWWYGRHQKNRGQGAATGLAMAHLGAARLDADPSGGNAADFALWRPLSDPDFPWLGVLIASPIIGVWYWCTDQYIVQRTLTSRPAPEQIRGLTYASVRAQAGDEIGKTWDAGNKLMAALILLLVGGMYWYFSFWLS
jgi:hypothetical protein